MLVTNRILIGALVVAVWCGSATGQTSQPTERIVITAADYWVGGVSLQQRASNLGYIRFMEQHPEAVIRSQLPGINIPGPASAGATLMRFVGDTSPDILFVYLSNLRQFIEEGFLAPLDDAIGHDRDGDGVIEPEEVVWEQWWSYPVGLRMAATWQGHIYAIPDSLYHISGLAYRRDLFAEAGLDPNHPPESFEALFRAAQRLTRRDEQGELAQVGLLLSDYPAAIWHHGIWDAGGEMVMQVKRTTDGREVLFALEQERTVDPVTGEDLTRQLPQYRATFAGDAGRSILDFLHRLRWQPWVRAPSGEPVDLSDEEQQALQREGTLTLRDPRDGQPFQVTAEELFTGVIRLQREADQSPSSPLPQPFLRGQVAMMLTPLNMALLQQRDLPRTAVGFARAPTPTGEPGFVQSGSQFKALFRGVMQDPRKYQLAQQALVIRSSRQVARDATALLVASGNYRHLPPPVLCEAGFEDLVALMDPAIVTLFDDLLSRVRTEPFNPGWFRAMELFRSKVFDTLFYDPSYDYQAGLTRAAEELNTRVFVEPEALLAPHRRWGYLLLAGLAVVFGVGGVLVVRSHLQRQDGPQVPRRHVGAGVVPWLLLLPALGLIALWSYYPLVRGSVMAFQDYRLFLPTRWVGVDNFLLILLDPNFYHYCWNTLLFAVLVLAIGFAAPLILALMLSEVPRGKYLFRTIFYLPSVTAGLVIMLLWKQMYEPTYQGLLNQLLRSVGLPAQAWLHDPKWAMICVIIPSVWAGAGAGSLIYLAALKSIPEEMYEAAEVDGANLWLKLRHVTLPMLKPLLIINFVGAFIGAFQGMGNILVMTGGGPADATRVLALDIWIKSFSQLEFGLAVAMAWILGAGLIGFTVMQLRILRKVDFRRAEGL